MYQLGAICYMAWGLLHLQAADRVRQLAARQPAGPAQGRLYQAAWNLAYFAVFVLVVAVWFNWRNDPLGYWLNLLTATVTDVGFLLFIVRPGYLPLRPALLGPALWLLAALFSTLGVLVRVA